MYANYSLGRASVLKATETESREDLIIELKNAIDYFEKSTQEGSGYNPGIFCTSFYRSYVAIAFEDANDNEFQNYLRQAKNAMGSSESRAELLKAVEILSMALKESEELKRKSIAEIACELDAYRISCIKARLQKAELHITSAEKRAPGAVKLMRKCNPLLEDRILATIAEIQKSARKICEITHGSGTEYEAPGAELQKAAKGLSTGDLPSVQNYSSKIAWQLKKFCKLLPPEDKEQVCSIVEEIVHETDIPEKLHKVLTALLCLSPILEGKSTSIQKEGNVLQRIETKLDIIHENTKHLGIYLNNIEFAILNLKDSTGNTKKHLLDIENEVGKLQREIEAQGLSEKELAIALEDKDHTLIERLTKMDENMSITVREIVNLNSRNRDFEALLDKLDEKDGLKKRDILGIISDISQLSQIALKIYLTGNIV